MFGDAVRDLLDPRLRGGIGIMEQERKKWLRKDRMFKTRLKFLLGIAVSLAILAFAIFLIVAGFRSLGN